MPFPAAARAFSTRGFGGTPAGITGRSQEAGMIQLFTEAPHLVASKVWIGSCLKDGLDVGVEADAIRWRLTDHDGS